MNRRTGIRVIVLNLLLFAALYGLVTLNKALLRPNLLYIPAANVLTGCFPNFIAAYLLSLAFVNGVLVRNPKRGRLIVYASSFVVFTILAIEELKPMWGASTYYDPFDILASGLGSLLSVSTFEIISMSRKHKRA
jgi:hypothetical protein